MAEMVTPEERFNDNVRAIEAALAPRKNSGMELFVLCSQLVQHEKMHTAAPLAMSLIAEACDRYRRDNYEAKLAAVAKAMKEPTSA